MTNPELLDSLLGLHVRIQKCSGDDEGKLERRSDEVSMKKAGWL